MKKYTLYSLLLFIGLACSVPQELTKEIVPTKETVTPAKTQTVKNWEKVTLRFEGPATSESAAENPFLDYRLIVHFKHFNKTVSVPGFYAADGQTAETSSKAGNIWKVHWRPDLEGEWTYEVSFRKGANISVSTDIHAGEAISFNGEKGVLQVIESSANAKGRLKYVSKRYLQYAQSKKYFIKGGADSPENFLGYADFDGTERFDPDKNRDGEATAKKQLHQYIPHIQDWKSGDPIWKEGKGKGIIGALNYLASKGMNSVYFLTMNINGDGKDVYPYTSYEERLRFDCSKLAQWEIVFDHMDALGLMQHIVLQETENELLLDEGNTELERKLYLRELIARFAHHPQLKWNIGEENGPVHWAPKGQNTAQQKAMLQYIKDTDPYKNFLVVHSHSDRETQDLLFTPLLGFQVMDGISMQIADRINVHETTKRWSKASQKAGKPWVLPFDETGPYWRGVDPDDRLDNNQDSVRHFALWGNLMAGGAGAEWYFGYKNHNNDLGCEDWRTRDRLWDYTRHAMTFFNDHLPFVEMESHDELIEVKDGYCFAKLGAIYAVYLPAAAATTTLDLREQTGGYSVAWYNPRTGGELQKGSIEQVSGGRQIALGNPPSTGGDWVVLVSKI